MMILSLNYNFVLLGNTRGRDHTPVRSANRSFFTVPISKDTSVESTAPKGFTLTSVLYPINKINKLIRIYFVTGEKDNFQGPMSLCLQM